WALRFVLAGPHPLVAASELPEARITYLPALRRWRRASALLTLPVDVLRLARLARDADLLYACTLSSFPYCHFAGRVAHRPQVVHVYSSCGAATHNRRLLCGGARQVVAWAADSVALAARAVGGFPPPVRARVVYNGMDVERITRAAAEALPGPAPGGRPRIGM